MIPVLILAAGASSRMRGTDKLLEPVDGTPLLRRQVEIALEVSSDVRVAMPPAPHPRYDVIRDTAARLTPVPEAAEGMGASLRTIFGTLEPEIRHAMLLLGDLPEITARDLGKVASAVSSYPDNLIWRGATQDNKGGHPIVFSKQIFPNIVDLRGDDGGRSVVQHAGNAVCLVPLPGQRARLDLDTPHDWAAWRAGRPPT